VSIPLSPPSQAATKNGTAEGSLEPARDATAELKPKTTLSLLKTLP